MEETTKNFRKKFVMEEKTEKHRKNVCDGRKKIKSLQHLVFPSGHPSKY